MKALARQTKHRKIKMMGLWVILSIFVLLLFNSSGEFISASVQAQSGSLDVEDLTGSLTKEDLVNQLVGSGITVSNVSYTGANVAAGKFHGGTGIIGFEEGIVLSTGSVANVVGPNQDDDTGLIHNSIGDTDLETLTASLTRDAAVLEFDFVPVGDSLSIRYVFASEDYNEYVGRVFVDVVGFFVNEQNCATVNGDPVSVNTINNGNPVQPSIVPSHPELYINNDLQDGGGSINTEMDGLTVVLTCVASVTRGGPNHIKLAIADVSDSANDSNVFIKSGSLISDPPRSRLTHRPTPHPPL